MQAHIRRIRATHVGDDGSAFDGVSLPDPQLVVVGVGREVVIVVLENNQLAVTPECTARVDHFAAAGGVNGLALLAGDVDALVALFRNGEAFDYPSLSWPMQES